MKPFVSIDVTIICDGCGILITAGRTAEMGRRDLRALGGRAALPGGKDLCPACVKEGRQPE